MSLEEMLVKRKKGRLDVLRSAVTNGELEGRSLVDAVVASVEDGYPLLANYSADHAIPKIGEVAIPLLIEAFHPDGTIPDARRLRALRHIDPDVAKEQARRAIEAANESLSREVFTCLSGSEQDADLLLRMLDKASDTEGKRRVYEALAGIQEPSAVKDVIERFLQGDGGARFAMTQSPIPAYTEACVEVLEGCWGKIEEGQSLHKELAFRLFETFVACEGHGGEALDRILLKYLDYQVEGGFANDSNCPVWSSEALGVLLETVALSDVPKSQRALIEMTDQLESWRKVFAMIAAAQHGVPLFETFSRYVQAGPGRFFELDLTERWPTSIRDAVGFVLFPPEPEEDEEGYEEDEEDYEEDEGDEDDEEVWQWDRKHPAEQRLADHICQDERWKTLFE